MRLTATSLQFLQAKEPSNAQIPSRLQFAHLTGTVGIEVIAIELEVTLMQMEMRIRAELCCIDSSVSMEGSENSASALALCLDTSNEAAPARAVAN